MGDWIVKLIESVYNFLWGDLIVLPLPGGGTLPLSLLVIILIPAGIYFTVRTRFLPLRLFPDMVKAVTGKKTKEKGSLSVMQSLIVSTATRVGMGNLVGVVAAISAGGAGAVFWMWVTALIGSRLHLSKEHWRSFIKKRILCTEDTGEVRHIIYINISRKKEEGRSEDTAFFLFCLPFPD